MRGVPLCSICCVHSQWLSSPQWLPSPPPSPPPSPSLPQAPRTHSLCSQMCQEGSAGWAAPAEGPAIVKAPIAVATSPARSLCPSVGPGPQIKPSNSCPLSRCLFLSHSLALFLCHVLPHCPFPPSSQSLSKACPRPLFPHL